MFEKYKKQIQLLFPIKPLIGIVLMVLLFLNQARAQNFAALFYFANHGHTYYDTPSRLSPTGDVWIMNGQTPAYGPGGGVSHWWGKPLWAATHGDGTIKNNYLMYFNGDPNQTNNALLDWHADLITTAGIDFIILDITNNLIDYNGGGPSYISGTYALLNRYKQRLALGLPIPKVVFFVRQQTTLQNVQDRYFNNYPAEIFFEYLGKKLVLTAAQDGDSGIPAVPTTGLYANYTARRCWGLDPSGNFWQFKVNANPPAPAFYYNGQPEEMSATVATQASYMTNDGVNPYPGAQGRQNGAYFTKYMDAAISTQPKFVFINGWNEWAAGNWASAGQPPQFVDLWGQEYSHDIEPMAGGHGWQYYNLMNQKVSEFKKKSTATVPDGTYQMSISSDGSVMSTVTSATIDGVLINTLPFNGQLYQQWDIQQVEPGYYKITNKNSGKVLDVEGYSNANGGFIHQWTWVNGENQKWSIQAIGNGYYRINNKLSGKVLDVSGAKSGNGLEVLQWEYLNAANQKWKITPPCDMIEPYMNINNSSWVINANGIACAGGSIGLGPHPVIDAGWNWTGPNNFTSTTRYFIFNNIQADKAGTYTAKYTNAGGCTSSISYKLTVNPLPSKPMVTKSGSTLQSTSNTAYQWYGPQGIITGAVNQNYTPTSQGSYYVVVMDGNNCSAQSDSYNVLVTGLGALPKETFEVYPNPVNDAELTIKTPAINSIISIVDILGTEIYKMETLESNTTINTQKLGINSGTYFITVKGEQFFQVRKIIVR